MARRDPETWTDADTAPVPARVFQKRPLLIDAEISKRLTACIPPKIRTDIDAVAFGRRALEVAILQAHMASIGSPRRDVWEPSWLSIRDSAADAGKALQKVLRALDPNGRTARSYQQPLNQTRIGNAKYGPASLLGGRRAKRDGLTLIAAQRILRDLAADSERRRIEIREGQPTKSSNVKKHAFVFVLYEAWIWLTTGRPGSNTATADNPFLLFVEAAWQDWLGAEAIWETRDKRTSFVQSLNVAKTGISDTRAALLATIGPSWAA